MAPRKSPVKESAREREAYRYSSYLLTECVHIEGGIEDISTRPLSTCSDTTLTAFAQLAACQTDATRAHISILDTEYQYVVAEATKELPLEPSLLSDSASEHSRLTLCGTVIPRAHGVCEHALNGFSGADDDVDLPLMTVPDLMADERFRNKSVCHSALVGRCYAAVPIRSNRGVDIGVLSVSKPPSTASTESTWTLAHAASLRSTSRAIGRYLYTRQLTNNFRRSERMTRGIGSFMEQKSTLSGWQNGPNTGAYFTIPSREGALNREQQQLESRRQMVRARSDDQPGTPSITPSPGSTDLNYTELETPEEDRASPEDDFSLVLSKAANIIREAVEVEGCAFVDAASHRYEGRNGTTQAPLDSCSTSLSSGEENRQRPYNKKEPCEILGFSTSEASSINSGAASDSQIHVPEGFMATLLRRYPQGKIFSFSEHGEQHGGDSSSDHLAEDVPIDTIPVANAVEAANETGSTHHPWSRQREGANILKAFPGARNVAFMPISEPQKRTWLAGGFIWTRDPTRIFSVESELSYLGAFGTLAAVEIMRLKLILDDKSKADALGSVSHELRSPLHGIILGAQLLQDTKLTVSQGDIVHTLETCGRTLSDTLDHLLDFSKINQYKLEKLKERGDRRNTDGKDDTSSPAQQRRRNPNNRHVSAPDPSGIQSLSSVVNLDQIVEEVVESIFAGFTHQHMTAVEAQAATSSPFPHDLMDKRRAQEELNGGQPLRDKSLFEDVLVLMTIDSGLDWRFHTQPGAVRRIVMNLFANALKYTDNGVIHISLGQKPTTSTTTTTTTNESGRERTVTLTVADTGSGMGRDFLRHGIFRPFSQENYLLPGTGLGLSIVKRTVMQLQGHISIQSRKGLGTAATVSLPLLQVPADVLPGPSPTAYSPNGPDDIYTSKNRSDLKGLRILIAGFTAPYVSEDHVIDGLDIPSRDDAGVSPVEWTCREWLGMTIVGKSQAKDLSPDLVLVARDEFEKDGYGKSAINTPHVVVCPNISQTQRQGLRTQKQKGAAKIVEYVSQPLGPHKLARMLLLAFGRWTDTQSESSDGFDSDPSTPELNGGFNETAESLPSPSPLTSPLPCSVQTGILEVSGGNGTHLTTEKAPSAPNYLTASAPNLQPQKPKLVRAASSYRMSPHQVLLVDDNSINIQLLSGVMRKLRQRYSTASNGQAALDTYVAAPLQYRCIIMDVSMPILDGFEATRLIRQHEREQGLKPTVIVGLSGLASAEAHAEAKLCGMDGFQPKPATLNNLRALLVAHGLLAE